MVASKYWRVVASKWTKLKPINIPQVKVIKIYPWPLLHVADIRKDLDQQVPVLHMSNKEKSGKLEV